MGIVVRFHPQSLRFILGRAKRQSRAGGYSYSILRIGCNEYYEAAIDKYKLGFLSGLELREAQQRLLEAEERLLLSRYNIKLCEISLKQLSGKIFSYLE